MLKIRELQASVEAALKKAGRPAGSVEILLVSKTISAERVLEAAAPGFRGFGENRVQELLEKKRELEKHPKTAGLRWHMIGHLQTNKVRQVLGEVSLIQSLDRPELAEEIERQAVLKKISRVPCLIQINNSGEQSKFGL